MAADTLLAGATDLATVAILEDLSDIFAKGPTKQDPIDIPGRAGLVFVAGVPDGYTMNVPMVIARATHAEVMTALAGLRATLDTTAAALTLVRRSTVLVAEVPTTLDESCSSTVSAEWETEFLGSLAVRVVIPFQNLDGDWTAVAP